MPLVELNNPAPADLPATPLEWLRQLGGPAVVRIRGVDSSRCRGVSTLLHGDEPSGLHALHAYVKSGARPAIDVVATIASVEAALTGIPFSHRFLPGRRDLNRCFLGPFDDKDGKLAASVHQAIGARTPDLVVDLHNTSGNNPCFGVVPRLDDRRLRAVAVFTPLVMIAEKPIGSLNDSFRDLTTSVTIECGQMSDPAAHAHTSRALAALLALDELDDAPLPPCEVFTGDLRVRFAADAAIDFAQQPRDGCDLTLLPDVDRHNFAVTPRGTVLGWVGARRAWPLVALDKEGHDISRDLFALDGDALVTARDLVPVMMTTRVQAARSDCWTYIVARDVLQP